jgi:hypothetical protein
MEDGEEKWKVEEGRKEERKEGKRRAGKGR